MSYLRLLPDQMHQSLLRKRPLRSRPPNLPHTNSHLLHQLLGNPLKLHVLLLRITRKASSVVKQQLTMDLRPQTFCGSHWPYLRLGQFQCK